LHAEPQAALVRKTAHMRPASLLALIPTTLLALGATAAPALAADVSVANFAFTPASVTINQGDSVTWTFAGPDTNHSVTSDPGQADSFDSDPGRTPTAADHIPGSTFAHTFNTSGTFTYICKVHSFMTGKVVVNGPNGEPPADTTAPAITKASATGGRKCKKGARNCKAKPTTVRFRLSEDARVKLTVAKHPAANLTRSFKAGARNFRLSVKKLPPGKYTAKLTATDAAGNASPATPVKIKVR
jgi:plastocyanin